MKYQDVPPIVIACARRALTVLVHQAPLTPEQHEEAFLVALESAWEAFAKSNSPDYPSVWRATWNGLRRWWRAERNWECHRVSLEYQDEDGEWCCAELDDPHTEWEIECALVRVEVDNLLERLGLREQEHKLLELLSEGFSQHEIAEWLGHSREWVSRRLGEIRRRARELDDNSE